MKKAILFLVLIALLTPIKVLASPQISINSSSMNILSKVNEPSLNFLTITNVGSEILYNISLNNVSGLKFPTIPQLNLNQSIVYNFTALSNATFDKTTNTQVYFIYQQGVPATPRTFIVNSTDSSFIPSVLTIKQGDIVQWNNLGTVTHNVKANNSAFDNDFAVGNSFQHTFGNIEQVDYTNKYLLPQGKIIIINSSTLVPFHDPNLDVSISLHHTSVLSDSNLSLNLAETSKSIEYNRSEESSLTVKNEGNSTAVNIVLSSNSPWVQFSENNFNLDPGNSNVVTYTISPSIVTSSETDQDYQISITADSDNSGSITQIIDVYVPPATITVTTPPPNATVEQLKAIIDDLIKTITELSNQLTEAEQKQLNQTIQDFNISTEVSYEKLNGALVSIIGIRDDLERSNNEFNTRLTNIESDVAEIKHQGNESLALAQENHHTLVNAKTWDLILILMMVLVVCAIVIFLFFKRIKQNLRDPIKEVMIRQ